MSDSEDLGTPSADPVKEAAGKIEVKGSTSSPDVAENGDVIHVPLHIQIPWVAGGLAGLGLHLYTSTKDAFPAHPQADGISLAWLVFAVVGACINYVSEIGLPGGGKLAFRRLQKAEKAQKQERVSVDSLTSVLVSYASQMQSWTYAVNLLTDHLRAYGKDTETKDQIVARFCLERMEETKQLIGEEDDVLRISLWWFLAEAGGLALILSEDVRDEKTLDYVFYPGRGLCGQVYIEGRYYNLADGPSSIYYEPIIESPQYHGLLLVPVRHGTGPMLGVLSIDRQKREEFEAPAVDVASALADLLAYAYCHPEADSIYAPETHGDRPSEVGRQPRRTPFLQALAWFQHYLRLRW